VLHLKRQPSHSASSGAFPSPRRRSANFRASSNPIGDGDEMGNGDRERALLSQVLVCRKIFARTRADRVDRKGSDGPQTSAEMVNQHPSTF
jgi:hypothetical protein